jgi:hypothetical protein
MAVVNCASGKGDKHRIDGDTTTGWGQRQTAKKTKLQNEPKIVRVLNFASCQESGGYENRVSDFFTPVDEKRTQVQATSELPSDAGPRGTRGSCRSQGLRLRDNPS